MLTESKGVTVSFSLCVVILIRNPGLERIEAYRSRMGFDQGRRRNLNAPDLRELIIKALKECFRPEFLNLIDEVGTRA